MQDTKPKKSKKVGRTAKAAGQRVIKKTISLSPERHATLLRVGDGNLSKGVAIACDAYPGQDENHTTSALDVAIDQ